MDKASEALADVRGWLCDNLSEGDAGKVCGMLSVVSRHISELEFKNAELLQDRDLFRELYHLTTQPDRYVQVRDENAKLRELVRDAWGSGHPDKSCAECEIMDECHEHLKTAPPFSRCLFEERIEERMRELGIEVAE